MDPVLAPLLSPVILFFGLGLAAAFLRSDLAIPEAAAKTMALYLMAAIGLKGGHEVAAAGLDTRMLAAAVAGLTMSALLPVSAYASLRAFGRLGNIDAAAIAAHYGSISVVTFVTGLEALNQRGTPAAGYLVGVMALMETPAIVTGLMLARRGAVGAGEVGAAKSGATGATGGADGARGASAPNKEFWREVLLNGSVVLLVGSFLIGLVARPSGLAAVAPFFDTPFRGVLCLFLLDMGLVAARRLKQARGLTWRLVALGVLLPILQGLLGAGLGTAIGLDPGSATAFAILCASASYIAVPAAIRLALPEANPGLYLGLSLGVTFPFNVTLGIPLYTAVAGWLAR